MDRRRMLIASQRGSGRTVVEQGTSGTSSWVLYEDGELVYSGSGAIAGKPSSGNLPSVAKITVNEGFTSSGTAFYGFFDTSRVVEIFLPDSLITVDENGFRGPSLIPTIHFGDSVASVASYAFSRVGSDTTNRAILDFRAATSIPTAGTNALRYAWARVIVPDALFDEWKTAWGQLGAYGSINDLYVKASSYNG